MPLAMLFHSTGNDFPAPARTRVRRSFPSKKNLDPQSGVCFSTGRFWGSNQRTCFLGLLINGTPTTERVMAACEAAKKAN